MQASSPGSPQRRSLAHTADAPTPAPTPTGRDRGRERRLLITAGPTREPIDAVRFIGNRSSGRLGVQLADEACRRGWRTRLLLGPVAVQPSEPGVEVVPFESTADLAERLEHSSAWFDVLVMAAAVADYRPVVSEGDLSGKRRRKNEPLHLALEPTPDLLAACAARRRPGQVLVGFALEPRHEMLVSAAGKLARKRVDLVVANPLETMDAAVIEAALIGPALTGTAEAAGGATPAEVRALGAQVVATTGGPVAKALFAGWLLDRVDEAWARTAVAVAAQGLIERGGTRP